MTGQPDTPDISESKAGPELKALYEDIRHTLRVPGVNLVWRHLATVDGALPWVWERLRPLYLDPFLEERADALRAAALREARSTGVGSWSPPRGIGETDVAGIRRVLHQYHHTNPGNLIALTALRGALREPTRPPVRARPARRREEPDPETRFRLPDLVAPEDMTAEVFALALRLECLGRGTPVAEVAAGVPRQLAHWPVYLRFAVEALTARENELRELTRRIDAAAAEHGNAIGLYVAPSQRPPCAAWIDRALARFTSPDLIGGYIAKVAMLLVGLPGESDHRGS